MVKDLASLFRWSTSVEVKDRDGGVVEVLYIKLVGDVDYSQAQQYGLLGSRKLRKRLKDKDSVEHQSMFLDLGDKSKEDLIFGTLLAELPNFRDAAVADLGEGIFMVKGEELPDNPTLEDREKQQEVEEESAKERAEKLKSKMEEKSDERKAVLKKMAISKLRDVFMESCINYRCIEEFSAAFRDYCIFAGTYGDPKFKNKVFDNFDEFRNASPNLKRQLIEAYQKLELTGEQLKN